MHTQPHTTRPSEFVFIQNIFSKSIYCCQQQPKGGKHIFPYPCWDWISILHCSTMLLSPSGKPLGPRKKMWSQCESYFSWSIVDSIFLVILVLSKGKICGKFVLVFCTWGVISYSFVYVYIHIPVPWLSHLDWKGGPHSVSMSHGESYMATRCWHEYNRSLFRPWGLYKLSTFKTVCLFGSQINTSFVWECKESRNSSGGVEGEQLQLQSVND